MQRVAARKAELVERRRAGADARARHERPRPRDALLEPVDRQVQRCRAPSMCSAHSVPRWAAPQRQQRDQRVPQRAVAEPADGQSAGSTTDGLVGRGAAAVRHSARARSSSWRALHAAQACHRPLATICMRASVSARWLSKRASTVSQLRLQRRCARAVGARRRDAGAATPGCRPLRRSPSRRRRRQQAADAVVDVSAAGARRRMQPPAGRGQRLQRDVAEGVGQARKQEQVGRRVVRAPAPRRAAGRRNARRETRPAGDGACGPSPTTTMRAAGTLQRTASNARSASGTFFSAARRPDVKQHRRRRRRPTAARSACRALRARKAPCRRRGRPPRAARSPRRQLVPQRLGRHEGALRAGCESGAGSRAPAAPASPSRSSGCTGGSWCGNR